MKTSWIVVANKTCARIFTAASPSAPLIEIESLTHAQGRLHDREMTSALPGKIKGRDGSGGHAFEQPSDPMQHEIDSFTRLLAKHVEAARTEHKFAQLLLVAEPSVLGLLRSHLSEHSRKLISFELASNVATFSAADIRTRLPAHLPGL